ncbi:MAG: hypothetical protein JRG77_07605 [Deltaproteobacteria bacterium]|nr:hypothetical protein [Deltaproteobacteria bacterium]
MSKIKAPLWALTCLSAIFVFCLTGNSACVYAAELIPEGFGNLSDADKEVVKQLDMIQIDWLAKDNKKPTPAMQEYFASRYKQRIERLKSLPSFVFLKNTEFGNAPRLQMSMSDGLYGGKPYKPGASIMMYIPTSDGKGEVVTLLDDPGGMIRDLDVSYDGKRILFSWKKSRKDDDYHIYEMTIATKQIRQVTKETGVADIQGRYLPNDRILYHSTRCVSIVDCNEQIDVVNIYTCDLNGNDIVRLTYDQVSTQFPSILSDGRIVYTRWDYNDRGQIYTQGLFTMNMDGTHQTALYGNNSWYPTSLIQARAIPGSSDLIAIAAGHHTPPCGKLALVSVEKGREEGIGVSLLAPERQIKYKRKDKADQEDVLFQYPYPLNKNEFLVAASMFGNKGSQHFGIYWIDRKGRRELLAWDKDNSVRHPMPLLPRKKVLARVDITDPSEKFGRFYVDNVYQGPGLKGVPKGTIKCLRVIALEFRPAAVGLSTNKGEAGHARVCTPVSISGSWDVKIVLGDAKVYDDGSAFFKVPPRTPVYFQALDANGHAVQSMRSWSTLQPGETFSCVGCHESKNAAPVQSGRISMALKAGPQELDPFYGKPRGFSFLKEIQPILNKKCTSCHNGQVWTPGYKSPDGKISFSLLKRPVSEAKSRRKWSQSYLSLLRAEAGENYTAKSHELINWISPQSGPEMMKPYSFGAVNSKMLAMLKKGHNGVKLTSEEYSKLACWIDLAVPFCGDYTEANSWSEKEKKWYWRQVEKRKRLAGVERQ